MPQRDNCGRIFYEAAGWREKKNGYPEKDAPEGGGRWEKKNSASYIIF